MGTRSLTHIFNNEKEIACIYRQFDGCPSGMGSDLAALLSSGTFVNGLDGSAGKKFNGMGCFAAQLIGALKGDDAGGVYLYPAGSSECGEEYVYEIRGGNGGTDYKPLPVTVKCFAVYDNKTLYEGDIKGFVEFCNNPEPEEE